MRERARGVGNGYLPTREHSFHIPLEPAKTSRETPLRNAKAPLDCAGFDTVAVLFLNAEWSHEEFVDAQVHVEQRCVHPGEEVRVVSRVGCPDGKDASSLRQPSVHAVVDRVDPRYYCQGLWLGFETESSIASRVQ